MTYIINLKKEAGFSLVEVLLTIVVLSVVIISIISFFVYSFDILTRTKQVSLAIQIAQEQVETLKNMKFDEILNLGNQIPFTNERLSKWLKGNGQIFIESVPDDLENNIVKLTVRITWMYRGKSKTKDVVTYITRP